MSIRCGFLTLLFATGIVGSSNAQSGKTVVVRGGHLFDGVGDQFVPNAGLVIRAGKFFDVGARLDEADLTSARVIELNDD